MIIGITGGVGCGKSMVSDYLADKHGYTVLKADDIAKELELPGHSCYDELVRAFDEGILEKELADPEAMKAYVVSQEAGAPAAKIREAAAAEELNQTVCADMQKDLYGNRSCSFSSVRLIDKAAFASIIYSSEEKLKLAESIIHPATWNEIRNRIAEAFSRAGDSGQVRFVIETALPSVRLQDICDEIWYVYVHEEVRIERLMRSRAYTREKCLSIINNQISEAEYAEYSDYIIDNSGSIEETIERIEEILSDT